MQTHALCLPPSFSFPASHRILSKSLLILSTIDSIRSDFGWNSLSFSPLSCCPSIVRPLVRSLSVALSLSFSSQNWNNHYRIVCTRCVYALCCNIFSGPKQRICLSELAHYTLRIAMRVQMLLPFVNWWFVYGEAFLFSFCRLLTLLLFSFVVAVIVVRRRRCCCCSTTFSLSLSLSTRLPCSRNHATSLPCGFQSLSSSLVLSFALPLRIRSSIVCAMLICLYTHIFCVWCTYYYCKNTNVETMFVVRKLFSLC